MKAGKNVASLNLTPDQLDALIWLLAEEAQRIDDDGRDGSFDNSPLKAIYDAVLRARQTTKAGR